MQPGAAGGDPSPFWKPAWDLWAIQPEALCPCPRSQWPAVWGTSPGLKGVALPQNKQQTRGPPDGAEGGQEGVEQHLLFVWSQDSLSSLAERPALSRGPARLQKHLAGAPQARQRDPAPSSLLAALFNPMLFRVYSLTYRNRALCFRGDYHMPYS